MDETAAAGREVKRLLVTGGTGSLGRGLIQSALSATQNFSRAPLWDRVVCFSRDEFKQEIMSVTPPFRAQKDLRFFIGDVRDEDRLELAMWGVTDVVHAAALKWVAGGVYNVDEIFKTNVQGTMNVIKAAMRAGVKRVILVASDKGCHPANTYGASKFMAEQYAVQSNSFTFPRGTKVSVVRYGNVLWSRGSVAHRFETAKPYRLTDTRMTRFGITLSAAVTWVEHSLHWMRGGEVFVPELPSFHVQDVAHAWYHKSYPTREKTPIEITGLRPGGEKIHETLITPEESSRTVQMTTPASHLLGWVIEPVFRSWDREPWKGGDSPVLEGWSYSSGENSRWLSEADLIESFKEMDKGLPST